MLTNASLVTMTVMSMQTVSTNQELLDVFAKMNKLVMGKRVLPLVSSNHFSLQIFLYMH